MLRSDYQSSSVKLDNSGNFSTDSDSQLVSPNSHCTIKFSAGSIVASAERMNSARADILLMPHDNRAAQMAYSEVGCHAVSNSL